MLEWKMLKTPSLITKQLIRLLTNTGFVQLVTQPLSPSKAVPKQLRMVPVLYQLLLEC